MMVVVLAAPNYRTRQVLRLPAHPQGAAGQGTDSDEDTPASRPWASSLRMLSFNSCASQLIGLASETLHDVQLSPPSTAMQPLQDVIIRVHGLYAPAAFMLLQVSILLSADRATGQHGDIAGACTADTACRCIEAAASYGCRTAELSGADTLAARLYHLPCLRVEDPICLHDRTLQPQVVPVLAIRDSSGSACLMLCELLLQRC